MHPEDNLVEKRFTVLRIIATIYKVLGWIILIVGTLASLGILISGCWAARA